MRDPIWRQAAAALVLWSLFAVAVSAPAGTVRLDPETEHGAYPSR